VEVSGKLIEQKARHRRKGTSPSRDALHYLLRENKLKQRVRTSRKCEVWIFSERYPTKPGYRQKLLCSPSTVPFVIQP